MDVRITPTPLIGTVNIPTSKSVAHRMLICAALAKGESTILINSSSDDIDVTAHCLRTLGAKITVDGNRWHVVPISELPKRVTLDCGESGSTLRFMIPIAAALGVSATFTGHGRLPSRPVGPLLRCLSENGIETTSDEFPIRIKGKLKSGNFVIEGNISSQYITGLLLALPLCEGNSTITIIPPIESKPYLKITTAIQREFEVNITHSQNIYNVSHQEYIGKELFAKGDWSNAAFWISGGVRVAGLDLESCQGDREIMHVLWKFNAKVLIDGDAVYADLRNTLSTEIDAANIPDIVPAIAVVAATAMGTTRIYNAQRLKLKESDRLKSTAAMIRNLGGNIVETEDGFIINGKSELNGGVVDSFRDHRIVMAAAIASQKCSEPVIIKGAQAVNKSYPDFFKDFASLGGIADVL